MPSNDDMVQGRTRELEAEGAGRPTTITESRGPR